MWSYKGKINEATLRRKPRAASKFGKTFFKYYNYYGACEPLQIVLSK